jgi:2-oxo-4-hydroxy-4-carboxy-5-ureidoimidazoline decarboxylase
LITKDAFVAAYGHLFEHSPWVVTRAYPPPPGDLHAAFMTVVEMATYEEQLGLIRAHPELGTKSVALTEASAAEQKGAGLQALSPVEFEQFAALNEIYREKFGHPFIICVRLHSKAEIFEALMRRVGNHPAQEHEESLRQIGLIVKLRMGDMKEESSFFAHSVRPDSDLAQERSVIGTRKKKQKKL